VTAAATAAVEPVVAVAVSVVAAAAARYLLNLTAISFFLCFPSGAYNVDAPRSKLAASMKSRHYDKPDAFQPGPGAYKLSDSIGGSSNAPSYTMRPKTNPKNSAGPGAVPGPGAYSLASMIATSPGKSMTARRDPKSASEAVPGPGQTKRKEERREQKRAELLLASWSVNPPLTPFSFFLSVRSFPFSQALTSSRTVSAAATRPATLCARRRTFRPTSQTRPGRVRTQKR
jgi:hypothetical protein